MQDAKLVGPEA